MGHLSYLAKRLGFAVITVLGVAVLLFAVTRSLPGSAAQALLGITATPDQIAALEEKYGFDQPLPAQLGLYLLRLAEGDLGQSLLYRRPVLDVIAGAFPVTLQLTLYVLVLSVIVTVTLASIAASNRDGWVDNLIRAIPLVGIGMPSYWVGAMLLFIFALTLRLLPAGGYDPNFPGVLVTLFLPALTLTIAVSAILIRSLRLGLIEVLDSDHVLTARAKGLRGIRLFSGHVLANAAIPTITILTLVFATLIGGALVVEQVFGIPGVGSLIVAGFRSHDYALVLGVVLLTSTLVLAVNVVADLVIAVIDPRVTLS